MTRLRIDPVDAARRALPERFLASLERDGRSWRQECPKSTRTVVFEEPAVLLHRLHVIRVDAPQFHPSASIQDAVGDRNEAMLCMLEHRRVAPRFPTYAELPASLQRVLAASGRLDHAPDEHGRSLPGRTLDERSMPEPHTIPARQPRERDAAAFQAGEGRYQKLRDEQKAGLLNLYSKLNAVPLPDGKRPWCHVIELDAVDRDRLHLHVSTELHVQTVRAAASVTAGGGTPCFEHADGSLHKPPRDYVVRHSFKTRERFGNLQMTFFAPSGRPYADKVDADVDDAAGFEHVAQVIRNEGRTLARRLFGWFARNLPEGKTHPYDIHQILRYHQGHTPNHMRSACDGRIETHRPLYSLEYRTDDGATHTV